MHRRAGGVDAGLGESVQGVGRGSRCRPGEVGAGGRCRGLVQGAGGSGANDVGAEEGGSGRVGTDGVEVGELQSGVGVAR